MDGDAMQALRAQYGEPSGPAVQKERSRLDAHARRFIALSPFLVIASSDAAGRADASPRGDAPGFVAVPDDRTLLIPDRPGNRRLDTFSNIAANAHVGLIFMVPGINETLRVNGQARFTAEPALLAPLSVQGKPPVGGLLVSVDAVYFHCGKALIRSHLWAGQPRPDFPSLGTILADQIAGSDAGETDAYIAASYRDRLY